MKNIEPVVIFDLDGTLVDSSAGILASLDHALIANGVKPSGALSKFMIGPPLREIVESLAPQISSTLYDLIIDSFKSHYDSKGYLLTAPYDGIDDMIKHLFDEGVRLAIVTNKREQPTKQIVNQLGWSKYFSLIYSPDSVQPPSPTKAALIGQLLYDADLHPHQCVYIGDRTEDWHSARHNNLIFGWAQWGYSLQMPDFDDDSFVLPAPDDKMILAFMENPLKS